ncbi:MAG: Smr/MutS family protein [Gammaproteobacteria bacterium]|nr:Smr/MutS family protein [Gammaproteobacteria bacterium]
MCAYRKKLNSEHDDDTDLFRRAAGRVRPLQSDRVQHEQRRPRPTPSDRAHAASPEGDRDPYVTDTPSAHGPLFYASPGVQHKLMRKLKRGQFDIEDELDLHGMRVKEAGQTLESFLSKCSNHGRRCVRIIHGKGLRTGGSVLKENVAQWLRLRSDVVAFCSAQPNDGGTGAVYVLLKK